jgi:glycosyltransferase involved in cell wall biosynthesis
MPPKWERQKLAVLCDAPVASDGGTLYTLTCWGRIIEELSYRFAGVNLCVPVAPQRLDCHDCRLPLNTELFPLPNVVTAAQGFAKGRAFRTAFAAAIDSSELVFIRGSLVPGIGCVYGRSYEQNKPLVHWLVGNPMELLNSHRRDGLLKDGLGRLCVWQWERALRKLHRQNTLSSIISFGREIERRFPSDRNHVYIGSPIRSHEIQGHGDTCQNPGHIKIMCVCFMRPEKGIEFLLEAFSMLRVKRSAQLLLVGDRDRYPKYQEKLNAMVVDLSLGDCVVWMGHATQTKLASLFAEADLFAFPSLSEGAPYVLIEARAKGLPVVSTNVGGIPESITHGYDGLLVPPKDPAAMAQAIDAIIEDGNLRRRLIANGLRRATEFTVDRFVDRIMDVYAEMSSFAGVK